MSEEKSKQTPTEPKQAPKPNTNPTTGPHRVNDAWPVRKGAAGGSSRGGSGGSGGDKK